MAALIIGAQAILRQLRMEPAERAVLRSFGSSPAMTVADPGRRTGRHRGRITAALAVAVVVSPVGPIGPVRSVYPTRGISADWLVLGVGAAVLMVVLSGVAVRPHSAMHRIRTLGRRRMRTRESAVVGTAANVGRRCRP